jgi:hypothetical protein
MLGVLLVPPAWGLAGCSPEHDWREIRPDEGGFMVTLPAKPAKLTRPIHLESLKLDMTMHGAQVRNILLGLGAVKVKVRIVLLVLLIFMIVVLLYNVRETRA